MDNRRFLESYGGQSIEELIALEPRFRLDSLVLAIEKALAGRQDPNAEELTVLAIEALEREVDAGGFVRFFASSSSRFAPCLVHALTTIGCPKTALIAQRAIEALRVDGPLTAQSIALALAIDDEERDDTFDQCDRDYDLGEEEPISDKLFVFVKAHSSRIRVGS
ncbi:MAG TPA: DUF4375 domain-containing protein [Burkholderiaceae bacterium]